MTASAARRHPPRADLRHRCAGDGAIDDKARNAFALRAFFFGARRYFGVPVLSVGLVTTSGRSPF
ncbi:hypothetical protein, partial [Mycobacterium tuberculosis]|uniref:hypothetical protein n=1 Tax=Mycobacterium tuberculosis TaxID=1773 RepID=UPI0019D4923F